MFLSLCPLLVSSVLTLNADILLPAPAVPPGGFLVNVDFGSGLSGSSGKSGAAALGQSGDFWNYYTRDTVNGWRTLGILEDLKYADQTLSGVTMIVSNAPGAWAISSSDAMYREYVYALNDADSSVTFSNLPPGVYDLLAYCMEGNYELLVEGRSYGIRTNHDAALVSPPEWEQGVHYSQFSGVSVSQGQQMTLVVRRAVGGYTTLAGLQLSASSMSGRAPFIISQPGSQRVNMGATVRFSVSADGSHPLSYQWLRNGAEVIGATESAMEIANVQSSDSGDYSVLVSNGFGQVTSRAALLAVVPPPNLALLNVDFGSGLTNVSAKVGPAARGQASDFWNYYTRDAANGWKTLETLQNLRYANQAYSGVSMIVSNAPGAWQINSSDVMYREYVYALNNANTSVTFSNLPPGVYDLLAYCMEGNYELVVDGRSYGIRTNRDVELVSPPQWEQGKQYSLFSGVNVSEGQQMTLIVRRAIGGYATIAGLQLAAATPTGQPPVITGQPQSQTAPLGTATSFAVTAIGTEPLSYQWRFNDKNINGATASAYSVYSVQLSDLGFYSVEVTNAFGSVISSNAALNTASCSTISNGIVSWWRGENNAFDSVSANNGSPRGNLVFTPGKVGSAFSFNGQSDVKIPAATNLNVGAGPGFTVEAWIKPRTLNEQLPLVEWNNGYGSIGAHFWLSAPYLGGGPGSVWLNLIDTAGIAHQLSTLPGAVSTNEFHHVAFTYDKQTGIALIFVDGLLAASTNMGSFTASTTSDLYLGARVSGIWTATYKGEVDEVTLYRRALAAEEVRSIYIAGALGKCYEAPPVIVKQPASIFTTAGQTVSFSVGAVGSEPLNYQWTFNGTNISGAGGATLSLTNVQQSNAGLYRVLVWNDYGSVLSSNAVLTVGACSELPSGVVSWWRGETNTMDAVSSNNGIPRGSLAFVSGKIGSAFSFNGQTDIRVPAAADLNVGLGSGLTIETWIKPATIVLQQPLLEWNNGSGFMGAHLWLSVPYLGGGPGCVWANLVDISRKDHQISSRSGVIGTNQFHHVAVTYDKSSGITALYVDGSEVARTNLGTFTPYTSSDLYIGSRVSGVLVTKYRGAMDEVTLYRRALESNEIAAIYTAGASGKCDGIAPGIVTQPQDRSVTAGETVGFAVQATGSSPLLYQWSFNGSNILGATSSVLTLTNVSPLQAGSYSVLVANQFGSIQSSNALLTLNQPPVAICKNVTVPADSNCVATAYVDNGSFDPDGDAFTMLQLPPPPYALGTNNVLLALIDIHGATNFCAAIVTVVDTSAPTVFCPPNIVVTNAHDTWSVPVSFTISATDNCSILSLEATPPSGSAFPPGVHTVSGRAVDSAGNVASCSFTVTVMPGNQPPVPVIEVSPRASFDGWTNVFVIAANSSNTIVRFDGSKSYDLDDTAIAFAWFEGMDLFGAQPTVTNLLSVGTHNIRLCLDDGYPYGTNQAVVQVEVITPIQAIAILEDMLEGANLQGKAAKSLAASVDAATASFETDRLGAGANQLLAFQNKVKAQVMPFDPVLAQKLIDAAQSIIDAVHP